MKLKQMEVFVAVAECQSFSRAAELLYLSQPTVSAHIMSLEKELNTKLFTRNTKDVYLTEQGVRLYPCAREMVKLQKKIEGMFAEEIAGEEKPLRIAASTVPSQYLLPDLLAVFKEKYPQQQFEIREDDSAGVLEAVEQHRADLGFTGTVPERKNIWCLPFYEDELTIILPDTEHYRKIIGQQSGLKWILSEPVIFREEGSGTRKEAEKQLRNAGIDPDRLHVVATVKSTEAIKKSVKNGIGITVISKLAARDEIESGAVLEYPLGKSRTTRKINLICENREQLPKSAERFIRTVKQIYRIS